tara:strand:- start:1105 stop:2391 length:1287 start_codon:yes stop_codon:yes gene_type:complete
MILIRKFKILIKQYIISIISSLSMIFGFVREVLLARVLGISKELDFFLLYTLMYDLLTTVARDIPSGIQSIKVKNLYPTIFLFCLIFFITISTFWLIFCEIYYSNIYNFSLKVRIIAYTVISLSTFLLCIQIHYLNHYVRQGKYFFQVCQPLFLNIGLIFIMLLSIDNFIFSFIFYGLLIGAILNLIILHLYNKSIIFDFLSKINIFLKIKFDKKISLILFFILVQAITSRGTTLIERNVLGSFQEGAVSIFNFASKIWGIPLNIFILAVSLPVVGLITTKLITQEYDEVLSIINKKIINIIILTIPSFLLIYSFSDLIIYYLFVGGEFSNDDVASVSEVLKILTYALFGAGISTLLVRSLWAMEKSYEVAILCTLNLMLYAFISPYMVSKFNIIGMSYSNIIYFSFQGMVLYVYMLHVIRTLKKNNK